MAKLTGAELIAAIRQHAIKNYTTGGWDYLVECWEDSDIADCIGATSDLRHAISQCAETLEMMDEYRAENRGGGY
jgi:hypothetical protein